MRFEIKPSDRLHMLVWKPRKSAGWCAAQSINGIPIEHALEFPTWREAMDYACTYVVGNIGQQR